jgi:hypothetical protein
MTQFFSGDTRINKNGRPKGSISLVALLKKKLAEVPPGQKMSYAEALIAALLKRAIVKSDVKAQKLVMQYIDGLPKGSPVGNFIVDLSLEQAEKDKIKKAILGNIIE